MNQIHTIRVGETAYAIAPPIDDTSAAADKTWSAQKLTRQEKSLLERLCPPISLQDKAVRCQPVEGYPVQVTTHLPQGSQALTLHLRGRNLFDHTQYPFEDILIYDTNGSTQVSSGYSAFRDYMPIGHLRGLTITLNHPGQEGNSTTHAALVFYDEDKQYISGSNGYTHQVPETAAYIRFSVPRQYADGTQVQLELGSRVTAYQPYREQTWTAQLPQPVSSHTWEGVEIHGECTLWSGAGETAVQGLADPVAILQQLQGGVDDV